MDLPTLLVRETVQNSWDAAQHTDVRPINYRLDGWTMTGPELEALRSVVFSDRSVPSLPLAGVLEEDRVPVLVISDRGTTGLGGTTRADIVTSEPSDFADFVRNVGQPPDKDQGGGTYGYGKAVLFLASKAFTIVAYTRCVTCGKAESRLIAIGLGEPFSRPEEDVERLYTGRHWWGKCDPEAGVEPVVDADADAIASLIGLPGFPGDSYGTSIMIVGAEFGELDFRSAMEQMREAILWHCWPKMVEPSGQSPAIEFSLTMEGEELPLGSPLDHPDLRGFVQAYFAASGTGTQGVLTARVEEIRSQSPKRHLGQLGVVQYIRDQRLPDSTPGRPFTGPPHHVALMRGPRLVVKYLAGPDAPVPGVAWAGAFVADHAVDRAFAAAEPPTHDDWTPDILPRSHEKVFVNVGLRNIRESVKMFTRPQPPATNSPVVPLAGLAMALGGLLAGASGPGTRGTAPVEHNPTPTTSWSASPGVPAGKGSTSRGGGSGEPAGVAPQRARRLMPRVEVQDHELVVDGGGAAVDVRFRLKPGAATRTIVTAVPAVAVNDGSALERELPVGAPRPRVLHWQIGAQVSFSEQLVTEGTEEVDGSVRVLIPPDTSVAVTLSAEGAE
jgi:hypothetical protein